MIVAAIASFILFFRIKKNNILGAKDFFWHYAFGFAILALTAIQVCLINLGVKMSYNELLVSHALTAFAMLLAYLLFFRGTALIFARERFIITILPLVLLPAVSIFTLVALFYLNLSSIIIYTIRPLPGVSFSSTIIY